MPSPSDPAALRAAADARFWRRTIRLTLLLLAIWAFAGLGCGVVLAPWLNQFQLGGFPLGFWFAQQGSIVVFVLLIAVYALGMARIDRLHRRELTNADKEQP